MLLKFCFRNIQFVGMRKTFCFPFGKGDIIKAIKLFLLGIVLKMSRFPMIRTDF